MTGGEVERSSAPTVHQLRMFLTLAEELHFGRTAARLFMSQPALSRQLGALERRLGVELIARTSRSTALTPAGQALLPHARTVVQAMRQLQQVADDHTHGLGGRVVVGTVGAEAAMDHTTAVLGELRRLHPALEVEIRLLNLVEQFQSLSTGEVDVVFCRPPTPDDVRTHHLNTEPRVVCVSADDPLAGRGQVTLAELDGRTIVSFPAGCPRVWRDFWAADPRPSGVAVRYGPVVSDLESLYAEVAHSGAISLQPYAARHLFPRPGVEFLDVTDLSPCSSALAWHVTAEHRPLITAIRQAAKNAWPRPA
ncbi:LysR family transcriptional regulator [Amycolatopsis magusensis]|uniref:LysR family transcriptional regulator n=1 Tax=Amycolatopsis magusensis TaxID=882444 RepID=UPI0024A8A724|nr:LysR family transcriptional regulator [Amycolatopsis magusensis]MDI5979891.1 LysR family transcriptional regulator [Amycolatopsis magusensis]